MVTGKLFVVCILSKLHSDLFKA